MNLGKIIGVSKNRHIILRSIDWQTFKHPPNIGDKVFTIEKRKIGTIFDIFGPVSKPYLSVKLYNTNPEHLNEYDQNKGSFLYTFQEPKRNKKQSRPRPHPRTRGFHRISPK